MSKEEIMLQQKRFLERMAKKFECSEVFITTTLKRLGHPKYNPAIEGELETALDNYKARLLANAVKRVDASAPLACPVPNCKGIKQTHSIWGWVCSERGLLHYLLVRNAASRNLPVSAVKEEYEQWRSAEEGQEKPKTVGNTGDMHTSEPDYNSAIALQ